MDSNYDHTKEPKIYDLWEKSGAFTPQDTNEKKVFTIIMPPPNANNPLHIGHARFIAIEDVLTRYHRMKGFQTLWLPGSDHAGIETQFVFEKKLKEEGKSRFDFDRDTLYKMIWDYVQGNRMGMENQLKVLGASCDWTRSKFALDPDIIKIVYKTFKKLYDDGLVYRAKSLVNYCTHCGTAFSNLEVDHIERKDPLYYMKYGPFTLATVRPETKFGDTAVAVHPDDKRYQKYIGQEILVNGLIGDFKIKVIADSAVDPKFGTGVVKITPAHDFNDYEMGQRHDLEIKQVIGIDGKLNDLTGKYQGLYVNQARKQVVEDLKKQGLLIKTDDTYTHSVGVCYKCKNTIEPMLIEQWFLKVKPLTSLSIDAISRKQIKFNSPKYQKIAMHWLKNLKDWNISRQIVWGIQIPAWKCVKCNNWEITEGVIPNICSVCGSENLTRDLDTFDTWFSSSQWPFATLKTNKPKDFEKFYPTSVMETAYDILPFWVIRMIMMGLYVTGKVPFKNVVIHGLVRDKDGNKISKSKGNVIDPISMTNKYGSDALRISLIWGALIENDISLSEDRVRGQRNFSNKLWNIARYIQMVSENTEKTVDKPTKLNSEDKKLLSELNSLIKNVNTYLDCFKLNQAIESLYEFTWHNFADNYIEKTKESAKNKDSSTLYTLKHTYITLLKLLHPFAPFVTEAIWKEIKDLRKYPDQLLILSSWPKI